MCASEARRAAEEALRDWDEMRGSRMIPPEWFRDYRLTAALAAALRALLAERPATPAPDAAPAKEG